MKENSVSLAVVLGGESVTVQVDVPALIPWLRRMYRTEGHRLHRAAQSTDARLWCRPYGIWRGGRLWKRASSFVELRALLEWAITTIALERIQKDHPVLHAACVVKGRASVLIVGRHGAGKTTLALALGRRGWRVVVDDVIAISAKGRLNPIARPLSVKGGGWPKLRPADARIVPPPVRAVVVVDRSRRSPARVKALSPGLMVAELGRHSMNFLAAPTRTLTLLAKVVGRARGLAISGGSVAERCALVGKLVNG